MSTSSPETVDGSTPLSSPNFESKTPDELEYNSSASYPHYRNVNSFRYIHDIHYETYVPEYNDAHEEKPDTYYVYGYPLTRYANFSTPDFASLTFSLQEFSRQTLPSHELEVARNELLQRLGVTINKLFNGEVKMEIFGSCAANLSSSSSDLDICLSHIDSSEKGNELGILAQLDKRLREENYGNPLTILSARVPIVKLTDRITGIECDFATRVGKHRLKSSLLKLLTEFDDRFRPLVLAIKYWSKRRYAGDASRGTLNSFGHSLLIVHFFQACEPPVLPIVKLVEESNGIEDEKSRSLVWDSSLFENFERHNTSSLGELLFQYFEYYATKFDPNIHVVSTHQRYLIEADSFQRKAEFQERHYTYFCVQDPVDESDNVGRNMLPVSF